LPGNSGRSFDMRVVTFASCAISVLLTRRARSDPSARYAPGLVLFRLAFNFRPNHNRLSQMYRAIR
jgi:hypothetical protein